MMRQTYNKTCDICVWIVSIYNLYYCSQDGCRDVRDIYEEKLIEQEFKLFGDLSRWKDKKYSYNWASYINVLKYSYIGVTILLRQEKSMSVCPCTDTFHVGKLMGLVGALYSYLRIDFKEMFYQVMKIDSEQIESDNDNIHIFYRYLIDNMSEENKNSITTRSILTAVNKLSTLQFLLEKLKLEYRLEQKITDRHSLTFRDIVFFEYTKKSDIVDYIIEKNKEKENYPTRLEHVLSGHINDIGYFKNIMDFSKSKGWSLLITKKDLEKTNWWVRNNVNFNSANNVYNYMNELYKEQNIQKILLIKHVLSHLPEDIEYNISKYIYPYLVPIYLYFKE